MQGRSSHAKRILVDGRASRPVASICSQEKESGKTRFGPTQKAIGWDSFNRQPLWRGIIPRFAGKKQPCKVRLGQWKAAGRASKPAVRRFRRHVLGKRNIRARCVQPDTKRGRLGANRQQFLIISCFGRNGVPTASCPAGHISAQCPAYGQAWRVASIAGDLCALHD